jgi:hypothetical protein
MGWASRLCIGPKEALLAAGRSLGPIRHCVESATFRIPTVNLVPGYRNRRKASYTQGKRDACFRSST